MHLSLSRVRLATTVATHIHGCNNIHLAHSPSFRTLFFRCTTGLFAGLQRQMGDFVSGYSFITHNVFMLAIFHLDNTAEGVWEGLAVAINATVS